MGANNCTEYCEVCRHSVYNMEKHIQSEGHQRWVRKLAGKGYNGSGPRLPGESRGLGIVESPFPGRLRLGHRRG